MKKFEIKIVYFDTDPEAKFFKMKKFTRVIACNAENFTDAEVKATKWIRGEVDADFDITVIKLLDVSSVEKDKGLWFLCEGIYLEVDHKGNKKENKIRFLIQSQDPKKAEIKAADLLNDYSTNTRVTQIKETKIECFIG